MRELRASCLEQQRGNISSEDTQNLQRFYLCLQSLGNLLCSCLGKSAITKKLNRLLDEYLVVFCKPFVSADLLGFKALQNVSVIRRSLVLSYRIIYLNARSGSESRFVLSKEVVEP